MTKKLIAAFALLLLARLAFAQPQTSALINQQLDKPIELELNTVLPEAMRAIAQKTGVRIEATPAVWETLPWGDQTNITAKVTAVDVEASKVTVVGPKGRAVELAVERELAKNLRVGDLVSAIYTEAVAVSVSRAKAN